MGNNTYSISELLKNSVLESFDFTATTSTYLGALAKLLLAFAIGLVIYLMYKASFRGVIYSESFAITLVGMCVVSSAILIAISSNIILSLGCVGALSIVRYRTAIKSPMDLLFLFLTIGVGICIGAGMLFISVMLVAVMGLLLLIMSHSGINDELYVLIIHYNGEDLTKEIVQALGPMRYKIQSQTMRKKDVEMAVEIRVRKKNLLFVDEIRALERVTDVTVVQYNGDYIG